MFKSGDFAKYVWNFGKNKYQQYWPLCNFNIG